MNIKNLTNFLNKSGIPYETRTINHDYFAIFNQAAPIVSYTAVIIELITPDIKKLNADHVKIEKYCSRYNFNIYHVGRLNCDIYGNYHYFFAIRTGEAAAAANLYETYSDKARHAWEILQHNYYLNKIMETQRARFNQETREILEKYTALYLKAAQEAAAA